jgi:hypothetical protein
MTRPSWLIAVVAILGISNLTYGLVPDRPAPPNPYAVTTIKLTQLEKQGGACFGEWTIWRFDEDISAILLVHQPSQQVVYMPWSSNGWLNFRPPGGKWQVLYTQGQASPQERGDLNIAKFLTQRPPRVLERGVFAMEKWNVTVSNDTIEFLNTAPHNDRMTLRANAAEFVHNGRTVGGGAR